jgi:transcriptional regulator with AAA-type ATPase domain
MAEPSSSPSSAEFRWQSFFRRTAEALYLLNRHRRVLFVNPAWERLTGLSAAAARGLICRRRAQLADPGTPEELAHLLCPPPEVLEGRPARTRRLIPGGDSGRRSWDIDFFPMSGEHGILGILAKITPVVVEAAPARPPLPEKLLALRLRVAQRHDLEQIRSASPAMRRVAEQVRLASQHRTPVMMTGEAGTGKQWVARTIHYHGLTREQAFVPVDCAHRTAETLISLLFGDTGLLRRQGVGMVYLRQPSYLPRDCQGELCRWLLERPDSGPRLAGGFRVDPGEEVRAGRLLDELACALGTLTIHLPPLRERPDDFSGLVGRLIEELNIGSERGLSGCTPGAWDLLRAYSWPGNIRELHQALAAARAQAKGPRITEADLPAFIRLAVNLGQTPAVDAEQQLGLDALLEQVERRLIQQALQRARGNKTQAASLLAIWRPRLLRRMEALGIAETEGPKDPDE